MKLLNLIIILGLMNISCTVLKSQSNEEKKVNNNFSYEVFKKIREKGENQFFSPLSIQTALSMTLEGAKGETEQQLIKTLNLNKNKKKRLKNQLFITEILNNSKNIQLNIANSLWTQKDFKFNSNYLKEIKTFYKADIINIDFHKISKSVKQINTWVEEKTNDKIKKILSEQDIEELTKLILVNAIYFKADWKNTFNAERTHKSPFLTENSGKVEIKMMYQKERFKFFENEQLKVIEIPYNNSDFAMFVLLPSKKINFTEFTNNFSDFEKYEQKLTEHDVRLFLPKFKIESSYQLGKYLKELGIKNAFSANLADFSGIEATRSLFISKVIHKAVLEVNEKGSEAAAATVVTMKMLSVGPTPPKVFKADHPFFFYIKNKSSDKILFLGQKVR